MNTLDLIAIAVGIIGGLSAIFTSIGSFRAGKTDIQAKVIDAYEKRMSQMELALANLKAQLIEVNAKLDIAEKERIVLTTVLQGKNPEAIEFMTNSLRLLNDIHAKIMPLSTSLNVNSTPSPS
jgi:hypothetical protein